MKVKTPLMVVLLLAAAAGYLMGTESGRERRELILVKLGRAGDAGAEAASDAAATAEGLVADAVEDVVTEVS